MGKKQSLAWSYTQTPGDERNICYITSSRLYITHRNREHFYEMENVRALDVKHKVLLFPALVGGIAAPLLMVAGFNGVGNIWLMITLAFFGLLAVYFGLAGMDTLTVTTPVKEFDFFLMHVNPFLKKYTSFVNEVALAGNLENYFFLLPDRKAWEMARKEGVYRVPKDGALLLTRNNIPPELGVKELLQITDPLGNGLRISFLSTQSGTIRPYIFSDIPIDLLKPIAH